MITEDYCNFEISKLLKEKGFKECCSYCYGVAVLHNGVAISFDEECELKDEGRKNEIEYIEGGILYDFNYKNRDDDSKVWAAPTLWSTMKWLREVHNIAIETEWEHLWYAYIKPMTSNPTEDDYYQCSSAKYEEAIEAAIKYCLENLI